MIKLHLNFHKRCVSKNRGVYIRNATDCEGCKSIILKEYNKKYKEFEEQYEKLNSKIKRMKGKKQKHQLQYTSIGVFMFEIKELPQPTLAFDEKLWIASIEKSTVFNDGRIVFKFITSAKIEA